MRRQHLNNHALAAAVIVAILAVAAMACGGDDASPSDATPSDGSPTSDATVTSVITPGAGANPVLAVGTYVFEHGLDGHELSQDPEEHAECPPGGAVITTVPGTPTLVPRIFLGQFCLTPQDAAPESETTIILDLPDTGEAWEFKLEFDSEDSQWKVTDVDKISG